jgi:hypothetical protein
MHLFLVILSKEDTSQMLRKKSSLPILMTFMQQIVLNVIFPKQIIARLWHNSRPLKVSTVIWQTFNQGVLLELWLACMGFPSNNEVC